MTDNTETTPKLANPAAELTAMTNIAKELSGLDEATVRRILRWAAEAFNVRPSSARSPSDTINSDDVDRLGKDLKSEYAALPDFYAAASPSQENDKALVVGYWKQIIGGEGDFDAQSVNRELKNLGHGVANITSAFDVLMKRKPQLVIQTKKSGTSRQARKLYKLTLEGQRAVEGMIGRNQ